MTSRDPDPRPLRVLLYVDDSTHWHPVARLAGQILRATGGHLTIACSMLLPGGRQRALQRALDIVALPPAQVETMGRPGIIEYTLPDLARQTQADLVVVGRLGSMDRLTSGLVGHLVAKRTPASVLIARGRQPELRRVLVCTEGRAHGLANFELAALLAAPFHARVDVLHVASQMGLTAGARDQIDEDLRDFIHSDAPEAVHLRELQGRLRARGIAGDVQVRRGLIVEEVLDAVREGGHDLLVIGAHDAAAPGAHLYEDLAGLILRASPVSTLVVRGDRWRK